MSRAHWRIGDRYELFHELGTGACGSVWYGRDLRTGAEHAVKVLEPELTMDGEAVSAFYAMLGAVARLAHANIVAADEVVAVDGRIALAMRLVPGENLRALLTRRGLPRPVQAALMTAQLADGLAAAHAIGVAHGDVKPANVLCEPGENGLYTARLTDFGMGLLVSPSASAAAYVPPAEYLAPELLPGDPGTPAGDVYALGILFYEALAGRPPFTGAHQESIAELHRDVRPPWIRGLPDLLWPPIAACLEKRPEGRPAAAELAGLLRDIAGLIETEPAAHADGIGAESGPAFAAEGVAQLSEAARRAADTMAISLAAPLSSAAAERSAQTGARVGHAFRRRRAARVAEVAAAVVGVVAGVLIAVTGSGGNSGPKAGGVGQTATVPLVVLTPGPVGATESVSVSPSASASASATASPDASASASATSSPSPSPSAVPNPLPPQPTPSIRVGPSQPAPSSSPPAAQGPALVGAQSGKCLDTANGQFANGTAEVLFTCNGSAGQGWTYTPSGQLTQDGGVYCLDDKDFGTTRGTAVQLWACGNNDNQQWVLHRDGSITNRHAGSGLCLDVTDRSTADGAPIQLWDCNGQGNQQWYWR